MSFSIPLLLLDTAGAADFLSRPFRIGAAQQMMDWDKQVEAWFACWRWQHLALGAAVLCLTLLGAEAYVRITAPFPQARDVHAGKQAFLRLWRHRTVSDEFIDLAPSPPPPPFRASWIGGSDVIVNNAPVSCRLDEKVSGYTLPQALATLVQSVGGRTFRTEAYYQNSLKIGDFRRAILHVIASKPSTDAIVISLNPILTFNDYVVLGRDSRQGPGVFFMENARAFDRIHGIETLRPSEIAIEGIGHALEMVDQRGYTTKIDSLYKGKRFPFRDDPDYAEAAVPQEINVARIDALPLTLEQSAFRLLFGGELGEDGVAGSFLKASLEDLKESGIPTVLYIPPINKEFLAHPAIVARMEAIAGRVSEIVRSVDAPNITTDLSLWRDLAPSLEFRDRIHLTCGKALVDRVAALIGQAVGESVVSKPDEAVYASGIGGRL